jgi:hypothetical protein
MQNNDPLNELLSLRWYRTGNVRLAIPLKSIENTIQRTKQDERFRKFVSVMGGRTRSYGRILNLDQWLISLILLTVRFLSLRDKLQSNRPISAKIIFSKTRNATPFIGVPSYLTTVEQNGIPVCQDSVVAYPSQDMRFLPLEDHGQQDGLLRAVNMMIPLVLEGMKSLGVMMLGPEDIAAFAKEIGEVMDRGIAECIRVPQKQTGTGETKL